MTVPARSAAGKRPGYVKIAEIHPTSEENSSPSNFSA